MRVVVLDRFKDFRTGAWFRAGQVLEVGDLRGQRLLADGLVELEAEARPKRKRRRAAEDKAQRPGKDKAY